ncbi:ADP-ribosylglycohydrolase family protein [Nocardia sp. NPDC005978]|uniref:ADP-ribosylglycohydrolase family protein n=1 Tax=unclassified Nocardia TaxID=2637762 RepID=UPI0033A17D80
MLRPGEIFAGYSIDREVGRGGMGSVYSARHPRLPKLIALKLLHRNLFGNPDTRARFEREADVVALLDHPNIVNVYDRGVEDEQLWIAMQYVDGTDCMALDARTLAPERALEIITQTAAALDYAHLRGVLHRDVKPANILLSASAGAGSGFSERVVLSDFGIARVLDDPVVLTQTGMLNATLAFASPEQLTNAKLGPRSDQYSLACTLFRMLTGRGPFDSAHIGTVVIGHIQQPPPAASAFRAELPQAVDAVLRRALAKDPQDRYRSCAEFADAVARALSAPQEPRMAAAAGFKRPAFEVVHGCLLGGAVGDALGAPVESMPLPDILRRYGSRGVTGEKDSYKGRISDETQLTLFTVEALIRGAIRERAGSSGVTVSGLVQMGLLSWLRGQGVQVPEQPDPLGSALTRYPELMTYRGPTHATTSAMQSAAQRLEPRSPLGTRDRPINDSKGCAAVVRSAPFGFTHSLRYAFESACDAAALTHGNPSGWLPAGAFAGIVFGLSCGLDLRMSVELAASELTRYRGHEETADGLATAVRIADASTRRGGPMPEPDMLESLGYGVIGPDALAIAVCAALCAETIGGTAEQIFRNGVLLSVNHSGDSDSIGAICGALLGARLGARAVPEQWRRRLDAAAVIERLSTDLCRELGPQPDPAN